jgi:hypothetical protein
MNTLDNPEGLRGPSQTKTNPLGLTLPIPTTEQFLLTMWNELQFIRQTLERQNHRLEQLELFQDLAHIDQPLVAYSLPSYED